MGLLVSFAFLQGNYFPDVQVNEMATTVEALSNIWELGAMDGVPSFVMNCSFFYGQLSVSFV